jgi:Zn-dependent peptidase ImmA (M78 family)
MDAPVTSIIRELRALMPHRPLEQHEAKGIAERQANLLLERLDQHEPAVDVSLITELPRMEVRVEPSKRMGGISGFAQWSRGRWLIVVNRDDSGTRRRFTLSHEFKHVLDHPFIGDIYRDFGSTDTERYRLTEQVCDYFAACLLMPRNWLKRSWASGIQDSSALAAQFDTSEAAMTIRLRQVGLIENSRERQFRGFPGSVSSYFRRSTVKHPTTARLRHKEVCL